jgi:probable Rubsico expression protein CbbX
MNAPDTLPASPAADLPTAIDLQQILRDAEVQPVIDQLDAELIGLAPVKARIREIAAFLVVSRARAAMGLEAATPSLHMCFSGNPGTRKGHVISVTRDDLVGQYIGHTAPKTKEVLKKAMGGVLFIDEAYYLYRPENERDYGQEAIEILLQVMENHRDDLVVILAGYKDRMDTFFQSNPGMSSRIAHHIDFPDYTELELTQIAGKMVGGMNYHLDAEAEKAMQEYIHLRRQQPHFANARSIRNALDRARLRQANRIFQQAMNGDATVTAEQLSVISADDLRASRVFTGGLAAEKN